MCNPSRSDYVTENMFWLNNECLPANEGKKEQLYSLKCWMKKHLWKNIQYCSLNIDML